jgi:hypothetical protein
VCGLNQRRSNRRMGRSASGRASSIIRVIKSHIMRLTGNTAHMGNIYEK